MSRSRHILNIGLTILGFFLWDALLVVWFILLGGGFGFTTILLFGLIHGWQLFAFFHYRYGRQDEFLHLLTTAAEANAPLAPALRAYVTDRPGGSLREVWVATLLFFLLPGYYWIWYRRHNFDRKVARVAALLEMGCPLPEALYATPGVVPRHTVLAAAVGESTGQLALCLRSATQPRLATVWLEVLPRLIYPVLLLFFISGLLTYWTTFLAPRLERIFGEFDIDLPDWTLHLFAFTDWFADDGWMVFLAIQVAVAAVITLLLAPTLRWYWPVVGRFYRRLVQSRVLGMLGVLLEAGKPVPEALAILADSGYFPGVVERHLDAVRTRVEQGEPLADSLRRGKLLPRALVPLVQAAERGGNLPWVLGELSGSLANALVRRLRRISLVAFPVIMIAVGGLVAFIALGMFLPLIELMTRLGQ